MVCSKTGTEWISRSFSATCPLLTLQLTHKRRSISPTIGGLPGREAAIVSRRATRLWLRPSEMIKSIIREKRWNRRLIGLELIEGFFDGGVFIGGFFNSMITTGRPLTKRMTSGRLSDIMFNDGKLIDDEKFIILDVQNPPARPCRLW